MSPSSEPEQHFRWDTQLLITTVMVTHISMFKACFLLLLQKQQRTTTLASRIISLCWSIWTQQICRNKKHICFNRKWELSHSPSNFNKFSVLWLRGCHKIQLYNLWMNLLNWICAKITDHYALNVIAVVCMLAMLTVINEHLVRSDLLRLLLRIVIENVRVLSQP